MVAPRSLARTWRAMCCTVPARQALCEAVVDAKSPARAREPSSRMLLCIDEHPNGAMGVASSWFAQAGNATQASTRCAKLTCKARDRRHVDAPRQLALAAPCVHANSAHTLGDAVTIQALSVRVRVLHVSAGGPWDRFLNTTCAHRKTNS